MEDTPNIFNGLMSGGVLNPLTPQTINIDLPKAPSPPAIPMVPAGVSPSPLLPGKQADVLDIFKNIDQFVKPGTEYTKTRSYNADFDGANFARYYKTPNVFKNLGFSPWRDNEKMYNEQASWFDYFKRSASSATHLFATGYSDMLPWNAWSGDAGNLASGRNMLRAHAIGGDSRGGVGGFANNLMLDSGYTFGIIGEFATEELAMFAGSALLTVPSGASSWAAFTAKTAENMAKVARSIDKLTDLKTYSKALNTSVDAIKNVDVARDFYKAARSGATWTAKQLTPHTIDWAKDVAKMGRAGDKLNDLATISKGFGAFYRDSRAVAAVLSESKLEGGITELEVRDRLIKEEYDRTGIMPDENKLSEIYQVATNAGKETFLWNLPALYISNKIVFDKALKGITPSDVFLKQMSKGLKGDLTFSQSAFRAGKKAWSAEARSAKKLFSEIKDFKNFSKKTMRHSLFSFLNYTKENFAEGLQEVYQDSVSEAMQNYYSNAFYNPALVGARSVWGEVGHSLKELATSGRGAHTFASGFLMGSLVQVPQHVIFSWAPQKSMEIFQKEKWDKAQAQKEKNTNNLVNALNDLTEKSSVLNFSNIINEDAALQALLNQYSNSASVVGDKKAGLDANAESLISHIDTLLRHGKFDLFIEQIKDLKSLKNEELEEAFGKIPDTASNKDTYYQDKLNETLNKAEEIKRNHEEAEELFGSPYDPYRYSKDPEKFMNEFNKYNAWERAKRFYVYSKSSYTDVLDRMSKITFNLNKEGSLQNVKASDIQVLFTRNFDTFTDELKRISEDIKLFSQDPNSKQKVKNLTERKEILSDLLAAVKIFRGATEAELKAETNPTPVNKKKASEFKLKKGMKVQNADGKTVTLTKVGTKYAYDKKGNKYLKSDLISINQQLELELEDEPVSMGPSFALKEAFTKWLKHVAKVDGKTIFDKDVDAAFDMLKDYYRLDVDAESLSEAVNLLTDPGYFEVFADRVEKQREALKRISLEKLKEAYTEYQKGMIGSAFLEGLAKLGVFVNSEDLKNFKDNNILPARYYYSGSQNGVNQGKEFGDVVKPADPVYQSILELIDKTEQELGIKYTGKDITQDFKPTTKYGRVKGNTDKRTYEDLAAQYGFDPERDSEVDVQDILDKIIESNFSTPFEKAFARRLKTIVSPQSKIQFTTGLNTDGELEVINDIPTRIKVDARYASSDFRGPGLVLEDVLMREIFKEVVIRNALTKDSQFSKDITALFDLAKKNFPAVNTNLMAGINTVEDFIVATMSSEPFRKALSTIEYKGKTKSLWEEFTDLIKNLIKSFNLAKNESLLEEAVGLITNRLDPLLPQPESKKPPKSGSTPATPEDEETPISQTTTPKSKVKLNNSMTVEELLKESPEFIAEAEKLYREQLSLIEPDNDAYDSVQELLKKPFEQFIKTPGFKNFLKSNRLANLYGQYNIKENRTVTPTPKETTAEVLIKTAAVMKKLKDLGYSDEEIKRLPNSELKYILDNNLTREERENILAQKKVEEDEKIQQSINQNFYNVISIIQQLKNYEDVINFENAFLNDPVFARLNIQQSKEVITTLEAKKAELLMDKNFDNLNPGDQVYKQNNDIFVVIKKDKDNVYITSLKDFKESQLNKTEPRLTSVNKNGLSKVIKGKVTRENMNIKETLPSEITEEQKEVMKQTQENAKEFVKDAETIRKLKEEAAKKSAEEVDEDFFNSVDQENKNCKG
jgi:hypothetical protein